MLGHGLLTALFFIAAATAVETPCFLAELTGATNMEIRQRHREECQKLQEKHQQLVWYDTHDGSNPRLLDIQSHLRRRCVDLYTLPETSNVRRYLEDFGFLG